MSVEWSNTHVDFTPDDARRWLVDSADVARGRCPRCDDASEHVVSLGGIVIGVAETPAETGAVETAGYVDATQACQCECRDREHPGRPANILGGCGARWEMRVTGAEGGGLTVRAEDDPARSEDARVVREAVEAARTGVGVVSERWLPGVAALTGFFSLSAAVASGDAAGNLPTFWSVTAFVLLVVAIGGAAAALVIAYRAAYGWPRFLPYGSREELAASAEKVRTRTARTASLLRLAVGMAGGALVLLLVALGIVWFAPGSESAEAAPTVRVTYLRGGVEGSRSERCGELLETDPGVLRLAVAADGGADTLTVPMEWVQRVEPASCAEA